MIEFISQTLEQIGVNTKDTDGKYLSNDEIISDFQKKFESFSSDQKIIATFIVAYFKYKYGK